MKEKDYNLEIIRVISFLSVIIIHVANYYCRAFGQISQSEYGFSLLLNTLARISVPCFFMISGALLLGRNEPLKKHFKRWKRFVTALVIWSIIYYLWAIFYLKESYNLLEIFYRPVTEHLWYLYAIIPIYLVLPFLQVMCNHMTPKIEQAFLIIITIAVICNYILSLNDASAYYDLPLIGDRVYTYYFLIGYYLYKYKKQIPITQNKAIIIYGLSMIATIVWTITMTYSSNVHYEQSLEYGNPLIILSSVAFFLLMIRSKLKDKISDKIKNLINVLGSCSFGIYLIHILFLDIYKNHLAPSDLSAWMIVPGLTIGIATISFISIWLLRHLPFGKKIT